MIDQGTLSFISYSMIIQYGIRHVPFSDGIGITTHITTSERAFGRSEVITDMMSGARMAVWYVWTLTRKILSTFCDALDSTSSLYLTIGIGRNKVGAHTVQYTRDWIG